MDRLSLEEKLGLPDGDISIRSGMAATMRRGAGSGPVRLALDAPADPGLEPAEPGS